MVVAMAIVASIFFLILRSSIKIFVRNFTKSEYLMKNWYIVQSHSNFENKVAKINKRRI